ncbi:MAG: GtrA family protein [Firmicutes bacterium]|nr:GtrA family protein [Bacillota bacterium]
MKCLIDEKLLCFMIVGIVNTLFGAGIMFSLYNIAGCSYWISSAANYILASILSFMLNKKFTFRHSGQLITSGIRFAMNIAVCYLVAYGIAKPLVIMMLADNNVTLQENMAMLVGMCIFTGLNYLGQRLFVFKDTNR